MLIADFLPSTEHQTEPPLDFQLQKIKNAEYDFNEIGFNVFVCPIQLVHPDIIFQLFQPCFEIVYLCLGIIAFRETQQITFSSLVKADNAI